MENERKGKVEMGLKGTEEGTATRVMSECAPAPAALPLVVSVVGWWV